ncbi:MAG: hypothetical protein CMC15_16400 [Flavobacteriaceae bacterium]|nr:hypothetical protein [Flavobacteriaceae bacterium]
MCIIAPFLDLPRKSWPLKIYTKQAGPVSAGQPRNSSQKSRAKLRHFLPLFLGHFTPFFTPFFWV